MGANCSNMGKKQKKTTFVEDVGNINDHLKFKVMINNIKLRYSPIDSSYIKIQFGNHKELGTPRMFSNMPDYSFDFDEEFEYTITRNELHNQTLKMILVDKFENEKAYVPIKLYDIATGPTHNDHLLRIKNKPIGRVTFDCRMSQIIFITIRPEIIICQLLENLKEREYNFSLKLTNNHKEYLSEHSENFKNPLLYERSHHTNETYTLQESHHYHHHHANIHNNCKSLSFGFGFPQNSGSNQPSSMIQSGINQNQNQALQNLQNNFQSPKYEIEGEIFDYNAGMEENKKSKKVVIVKNIITQPNNLQEKTLKLMTIDTDADFDKNHHSNNANEGENIKTEVIVGQNMNLSTQNPTNITNSIKIMPSNMRNSKDKYKILTNSSNLQNQKRITTNIPQFQQNNHIALTNLPELSLTKNSSWNHILPNHSINLPEGNLAKSNNGQYGIANFNFRKEIRWDYRLSLEDPPLLEMELNVHDIASNSFQFFLWTIKEKEQPVSPNINQNPQIPLDDSEIYIDHKLIGECYVSLYKIYAEEDGGIDKPFPKEKLNYSDKTAENPDTIFELTYNPDPRISPSKTKNAHTNRISDFNEKLWYHGICVGTFRGEFLISNEFFYRQMLCGVLSDYGPSKAGQLILKQPQNLFSVFTNTIPKEVKSLSTIKDNLNDCVFKLSKEKDTKQQKRIIDELAKNLIQIPDLLKISQKESIVSYVYNSEEDLLASQTIFIDLASHMLEYYDEAPIVLKSTYFESLILIVNRGEFELGSMGFSHNYAEVFLQNAGNASFKNEKAKMNALRNIKQKLKVCLNYQAMLYKMLEKVLFKLTQKRLDDKEREFVEHFIAIAYFRIPEFREKLLECLIESDNQEKIIIEEWRGTEWKLDNQIKNYTKNKDFVSLFDWQKDFYRYLKDTPKGENHFKLLQKILADEEWHRRISKRGVAFCFFLNEWSKHVSKTVVIKDQVPWQDLPGYNILVKSFLIELKKRDVKHYPEALITASISLLNNEKLLSVFVSILFKKTRIFDSMAIFVVFDRINEWFQALIKNNKKIPLTFDNLFFVKGVTLILDGEHALNIAKVIWVIYNNFNLFNIEVRGHLCEYMLNEAFFKLFLHWSWNVRQVFHHLLLYRIYHQHRTILTGVSNVNEAKRALHLAHEKGQTLNRSLKEKLINDLINLEYNRNINLMEKIKIKTEKETDFVNYERRFNDKKFNQNKKDKESSSFSINFGLRPIRRDSAVLNIFNAPAKLSSSFSAEPGGLVTENAYAKSNSLTLTEIKLNLSVNDDGTGADKSTPLAAHHNSLDFGAFKDGLNSLDIDGPRDNADGQDVGKKDSAFGDNIDHKDDVNHEKITAKQKIKINRRFYLGRDLNHPNNKLFNDCDIPKELQVYLLRSWQEYERAKQNYKNWVYDMNDKLARMPEIEKRDTNLESKVPELQVKIPLDDGEGDRIELDDEW